MRLRQRRAAYAARRGGRSHWPVRGGLAALVLALAALAPMAPTILARILPAADSTLVAATATTPVPTAAPAPVRPPTPPAGPRATVPAAPLPALVAVPTLTAGGQALLAGVRSDRTAQWVKNHTETALRSGPSADSSVFTVLPQWSLLKQVESRPDWLKVDYSGDGDTRQPGPGWVRAGDVGAVDAPAVWLSASSDGSLWSSADASGRRLLDVPPTTVMEVLGPDDIRGARVHVRLPGNGRTVPPTQGWVDGNGLARAHTPSWGELPTAYPEDLSADVRIQVPYRSQLDGSEYAGANCGPTVLGMALETFGMNLAPPDLRGQVLDTEDYDPQNTDAGSYIWALARVAQSHGLQTHGLYDDAEGASLHHWSLDDIRASVRAGRPVILQVLYRGLPGREESGYYGDHYIIVTGLLGDNFLYNDPIGGAVAHEVPGYDREMTPAQLARAMRASDTGYAYTAFAVSRA